MKAMFISFFKHWCKDILITKAEDQLWVVAILGFDAVLQF